MAPMLAASQHGGQSFGDIGKVAGDPIPHADAGARSPERTRATRADSSAHVSWRRRASLRTADYGHGTAARSAAPAGLARRN